MLWQQCQQAWKDTQKITLPETYQDINKIVVAGMGGSHLGAQIINAVYQPSLRFPLIVQNEYDAPGYIDEHALVIATSYSGNTEETLFFTTQALQKKAKIICISTGGKLAEFSKEHKLPSYIFESKYNPSKIPRYGTGYLFIAQMAFLSKAGVIALSQSDVNTIIETLKNQNEKYTLKQRTADNPAKQLAKLCQEKIVVLVASQHLAGSVYVFKNQINESAKHFSVLFKLPELNHHLLEGLAHPEKNKNLLQFIFFQSDLYHERNRKRYPITQDVVEKQGMTTAVFKATSTNHLTQAFEALAFTSYVALYLSILNRNIGAKPNPWVNYFKEKMGE
jgi:glucose/mannose-6-phosphate isomerase